MLTTLVLVKTAKNVTLLRKVYKKGHLIALVKLFNPAMNIFGIIRIIMIRKYLNHLPVVNFTSLKLCQD